VKVRPNRGDYKLDKSVDVWSDYNSMYFHPQSLIEIPSYRHKDTLTPFTSFANGVDAFQRDLFVSQSRVMTEGTAFDKTDRVQIF
jgi:hypothetical protein